MADDGQFSHVSPAPIPDEELPDRLRVHSLARVLGTTSKRVLNALIELDGRSRSAHSSVDRVEAVRVRDLLGSADAPATAEVAEESGAVPDEPESRLLLETAPEASTRVDYMPLFVAPQPVAFERVVPRETVQSPGDGPDDGSDQGADDGADDDDDLGSDVDAADDDDADDENGDRPASRRRRRGRRGRGRGRGSEGSAADDADDAEDADDDTTAESDEAGDAEDAGDDEDNGSADEPGNRRRRRRRR
ncbi:MAG TPA: hypothetical protein VL179_02075, partial [Mycobacterium sp.]|nr:hypothetical protein [Mycobacterium sp.]